MDNDKRPNKEKLLTDVFDIVKAEEEPLTAQNIYERYVEKENKATQSDVDIALSALEAKGLIKHFTKQVTPPVNTGRKMKAATLEFLYAAVEKPDEPPKKPGFWERLFG